MQINQAITFIRMMATCGVLLLLSGCGGESIEGLQSVSGTVTLDEQPVAGASVDFYPESGSSASGVTDDAGKYVLYFTSASAGAMTGKYTVSISKTESREDSDVELIPANYNDDSELTAEVGEGETVLDFALVSGG